MPDYMLRRIFSIMRNLDTPGVCPYRVVYGKMCVFTSTDGSNKMSRSQSKL